jgi:glycosyltransferase involved in cell wall biosynthesis
LKWIPAVTILIDTYNHERFIEEAIVSVLEQDFPRAETEILVVDDGSTDRTPEIVRKFQPHVHLIRKANGGQASAFNAGIPEARGEIIAFLDGDDWWAKEKLKVVTNYLGARPHLGLVGHGICEVDSDTGNMKATIPKRTCEVRFDSVDGGRFYRQMMCFFGTSRVAIRRNILSPSETFQTERDDFQIAYKSGSAAYWIFKGFVLVCTLALPPKRFYQLRDWYSRSNWRRVRGLLGEPVPNAEIGNVAVTKPLNSEGKAAH